MASSKKIGFFCSAEKITVVEFEKNAPFKIVFAPLGTKTNTSSSFNSKLTEEIQITAVLQKMLKDNHVTGGSFYVSLPMKEIILRSFIIPFVKQDVIQDAVKFEAKKYVPFDIQDMSFVFYTVPFTEGRSNSLQVIFFAVRKDVLARYERIFKQINAEVSYCEPYMVSLTKSLLFKKEIKPTDRLAFLILDKNLGRICFIDQGIPQFIREFPVTSSFQPEDSEEPVEILNSKIVNEVGNSFDFYTRQFGGERIEQMLFTSDFDRTGLLNQLETELKVKLKKISPRITTAGHGQSEDMDAMYAMGACVVPPMDSLLSFNFFGENKSKSLFLVSLKSYLGLYKDILFVLLICSAVLAGVFFYYQAQWKSIRKPYDRLSAQEGASLKEPISTIKAETQAQIDKLHVYKNIRTKSDVAFILLRVASHLPKGALLTSLSIDYNKDGSGASPVTIDMQGNVFRNDPNEQIAVVNHIFLDFKNDKELSRIVKNVDLVSFSGQDFKGRKVTEFHIRCS